MYALDRKTGRPLPALKQVLDVLMPRDPWDLGFWFDAANSYLDGQRPQSVIASAPGKAVEAAKVEAIGKPIVSSGMYSVPHQPKTTITAAR